MTAEARDEWILVSCCLAQFIVVLDISIITVALPSMSEALDITSAFALSSAVALLGAVIAVLVLSRRAVSEAPPALA